MAERIEPTPFQQRVLQVPECYDLALLGGRGGGKSHALAFLILRHCELYGDRARCLYVRRTHASLEDFALVTREVFTAAYGQKARYNAAEGIWRLPAGYAELSQLADDSHLAKFAGRSFSFVRTDEAAQHATPRLLDRLRGGLRAVPGVPTRLALASNPGDVGHGWVARRHVRTGVAPWVPYTEADSGAQQFVTAPSTLLDNPHLDQATYRRQLAAACASDPELLRAWVEGDWSVSRGAFFGDCVSEARNLFGPWDPASWPGRRDRWETWLAHDFGSSAPSCTFLCARSPGATGPDERFYPRDSISLLDEVHSCDPQDPSRGLQWTIPQLSEAITELAARWGVRPHGVADDAIFNKTGSSAGSIADEFRRCGVHFRPAKNGSRVAGWQTMRRLLADAGKVDVPGLYVSRACRYWWETVPLLARDPRRPEDVDSRGPDHAADACRYGCGHRPPVFGPIDFRALLDHDSWEGRHRAFERRQDREGGR